MLSTNMLQLYRHCRLASLDIGIIFQHFEVLVCKLRPGCRAICLRCVHRLDSRRDVLCGRRDLAWVDLSIGVRDQTESLKHW